MPGNTCVAIVEPDEIYREGLRRVLDEAGVRVAAACSDVRMLDGALAHSPDMHEGEGGRRKLLVLADCGHDHIVFDDTVRDLRRIFPEARVVLIADEDTEPYLGEDLRADLEGVLVRPFASETLVRSLRQVCMGLPISSDRADGACAGSGRTNAPRERAAVLARLSARERDILDALSIGSPNKVIARRYGITEATVKVHVKAVLRKLGVRNRTEAALWARQPPAPARISLPARAMAGRDRLR